jgi:ABC-type Fe3+-hydroxamate transport system substrate-binding protein
MIDALGRELSLHTAPKRVVSLVPSDTYTLQAVAAGSALVGRTDYCEGALAASLPSVGGTKNIDVQAVLDLAPDLVIANQEENSRAAMEKLAPHCKIWVSMPRRFADGVAHVAKLARVFGTGNDSAVKALIGQGMQMGAAQAVPARVRAFVPIWNDPWMTLNADTFGSDMLRLAGVHNVFGDRLRLYPLAADLGKGAAVDAGDRDVRYPRVTLQEAAQRKPEVVLLSDEPCVFSQQDLAALAAALPDCRHRAVSGKDLFWYGAWSIAAVARLQALIASVQ